MLESFSELWRLAIGKMWLAGLEDDGIGGGRRGGGGYDGSLYPTPSQDCSPESPEAEKKVIQIKQH